MVAGLTRVMDLLSNPHVYRLFQESNYGSSDHSYDVHSGARVLDAILSEQSLPPSDVIGVSLADDFVAFLTTGIGIGSEYGMFRKKLVLGDFVPWETLSHVSLTEPSLKIFGIEVVAHDGSTALALRWYGEVEGRPERDRVCAIVQRFV